MNTETTSKWIQNTTNIAQILALIIAGIWAYNRWQSDELPSLEPTLKIESAIVDNGWNPSSRSCALEFRSQVENVSKRQVEVTRVLYYFGSVRLEPFTDEERHRFIQPDITELDSVNLSYASDHRNEILPNEVTTEGMEILYRPQPGSIAVIYLELLGPYGENATEQLIAYGWDYAYPCAEGE